MKPVRVTTTVPYPPESVYDFLDVMANHEPFTNHMLEEWQYSGPQSGLGSKAKVRATLGGRSELVDIEVIEGERPNRIVERNVGAGGRRVATGTYTLEPTAGGGTLVAFEYAWEKTPLGERLAAPLARRMLRSANRRALARLGEQLPDLLGAPRTASGA